AIGDKAVTAPGGPASTGPNTFAYFLRMIIVLALVLGVIYAAYRLMRRLAKPRSTQESAVRLLGSTNLGPGKVLHIVGLGAKTYLIGATDASISLIAEVEDKEFVDALTLKAALSPEQSAPRGDFSEMLGSLLGRGRGKAPRHGAPGRQGAGLGGSDFMARQRERLRKF
ncbi:MAG TPA: flagellar biosynthetic protein FliO, partial [Rectinemataceae bacterium]|nr:flagellar biosynthetic protein FliO [Rectinemataceae bacterium]